MNRTSELAGLERWWEQDRPRPALVWGRRRVGKTALLQRFAASRRSVFHLGSGRTEAGELAQLSRKVAAALPLYLSWWDQNGSVEDNLAALATRPTSPMVLEGDLVLATESRHGDQVSDVRRAIAEGRTKHHEIADAIGTDPSRTLRDLQELRLVERIQPVTESGRSRRRMYRITDNLVAFYLGVLGRYRDEINRGLGSTVLGAVRASVDDHMGGAWEHTFRDYLRLHARQIHPETVAVGPWWRGGGQDEIDAPVLAGRERKPVLVGEAKWTRTINGGRVVTKLASKAAGMTDDVAGLRFAVCAREQVTDVLPGTLVVTAADIFTPSP